jgi:hypothetical protein
MPKYKIDEINVLENYILLLENMKCEDGEELEEEDLLEVRDNIKKLKEWMKEIKSTGETHKNMKWKISMLGEILDCEKNSEMIPLSDEEMDKEGKEVQREYIEGIEEWLNDLKKVQI